MSARCAVSPQDAVDTLNHRILALANANDAILKDGWTTAGLRVVAGRVLEPNGAPVGPLTVTGAETAIRPRWSNARAVSA